MKNGGRRECPLSGHQESRPAGDGFMKDLLHLFKEKRKGSGTTELVHWLLREFNRAADKLADWALLARKISSSSNTVGMPSDRPLVLPQRCWHSTGHRRSLPSRAASPNQILGIWLNKLVVMFMPRVPGKTHLPSPVDPSSCYQQIFPSVYHPLPSASHPEIPVVIMCP